MSIDLTTKVVVPEYLIVAKTSKPVKIDGKMDKSWDNAMSTKKFIDIEGVKEVKYETTAKMLWDEEFLYVFAQIEEPHVWGDITGRDEIIYYNNDFEVFIDPSGNGEVYGEIEMNALNTVWDLLLNRPYRAGGFANFNWNLDQIKTAVKINGSLNDPTDIDKGWNVEMAIPLRPLIELRNDKYKSIEEGDQWRMNFSRVNWDYDLIDGKYSRKKVDGKYLPEYNWVWSNQTKINMHMPEMWGVAQFTEKDNFDGVKYIQDPDLMLKQALYALYREANWGELKSLKNSDQNEYSIRAKCSPNEEFIAQYSKTLMGYEISIESSETDQLYVINEQGERRQRTIKKDHFAFSTWAHGDKEMDTSKWSKKLDDYASIGISEVLIGGSPEFLSELVKLAKPRNMKIHAWMWTLNRPNDTIANKHPEWYAVKSKRTKFIRIQSLCGLLPVA